MDYAEKALRNLSLVEGGQLSPFWLRLPKFLYIAEATAGGKHAQLHIWSCKIIQGITATS